MLVVLGLDSWDHRRYQQLRTPIVDKLEEQTKLKPFDGLSRGELVTQVLWPSMMIGDSPKILFPEWAAKSIGYETGNQKTDNSFQNRIEDIGTRFLPERARPIASIIGERIGLLDQFNKHTAGKELIESHSSVLDAASDPCLISIPGVNEDMRNYELTEMMDTPNGKDISDAKLDVTPESYERRAFELDSAHLAETLQAISRGHDLVWSHFAGMDFIQHMFADSERMMQRWYRFYDNVTEQVLQELDETDTLVVISDHGMDESGLHSTRAFFASTKSLWGETPAKMESVRNVLERELQNHETEAETDELTMQLSKETESHLEDLGYIS
jgi:hypothetical protein